MDLRSRLYHAVFNRPHVFILAWPGAEDVRREAERLLRVRGWPLSLSPADTDVLLVLTPDGTLTGEAASITWRFFSQMPQPAVRAAASTVGDLSAVLDQVQRQITTGTAAPGASTVDTTDTHRAMSAEHGARKSPASAVSATGNEQAPQHQHHDSMKAGSGHGGTAADADPVGSTEMAGDTMSMDMTGHTMSTDMTGDMTMDPGGVPLAGEAKDRDGLSLDVLHLDLGPALPWWPAGLQVRVTIQGDVITAAQVRIITADTSTGQPLPALVPTTVAVLQALSRLLFLAGDDRHGWGALRLLNDLSAGPVSEAALTRWSARVGRAVLLRSMLQRIPLPVDDGDAAGPIPDVWSCVQVLLRMLGSADQQFGGGELVGVDLLPAALVGRELAEARLVIAALTSPAPVPASSGHR